MDIGSTNGRTAADIAAGMCERIREAHNEAEPPEVKESKSEADVSEPTRNVNEVGAKLRARLEAIVEDVVFNEVRQPSELLGAVVDEVVTDRIERSELEGLEAYREELTRRLSTDPVVVAELDDILQTIAQDLARRRE